MTIKKDRILVTGGTGYIGSHTVVELQQAGYPVVIIDNLSNSSADVVDGIERITGVRPDFVKGDCTDINTVKALFADYPDIKGIINFAASKAVGESVQKPILYYRNNLNTLLNLLDLMGPNGVKGIVFSSSCTVYGEPDENPVTEAAPIRKQQKKILPADVQAAFPYQCLLAVFGLLPVIPKELFPIFGRVYSDCQITRLFHQYVPKNKNR